ncbi:hypothetical protein MRB53_039876 [Persea americana]|nr:hypothetical protein MRB53_039876 [Persea americana]
MLTRTRNAGLLWTLFRSDMASVMTMLAHLAQPSEREYHEASRHSSPAARPTSNRSTTRAPGSSRLSVSSATAHSTPNTVVHDAPGEREAPANDATRSTSTLSSGSSQQLSTYGKASGSPMSSPAQPSASSQTTRSPAGSATTTSPQRIKVRDLHHIQSFVGDDATSSDSSLPSPQALQNSNVIPPPQYEISDMPVTDIIEMVAGLLTKITATNDRQHEHLHRQIPSPEGAAGLSQQTNSVLAFHGKNVPSITILSYLSRIHKYCPTTYEVFLSLLVYFDRMTEKVNSGPVQSLRQANQQSLDRNTSQNASRDEMEMSPPPMPTTFDAERSHRADLPSPPLSDHDPVNLSHFFVVDSFNIHRLVIAGVTCASKFFSDVFLHELSLR